MAKLTFDEVSVDQVIRAKRGRKPTVDSDLVDAIKEKFGANPETVLRITSFGHVNSKDKRQTIQQQIRTAARVAMPLMPWTVEWTPEGATDASGKKDLSGYPQLRINQKKLAEVSS